MHEFGYSEAILRAVEKRADGRRVSRLKVRIGDVHGVTEPALAQSFEMAAAGTVADGAVIDLVTVPGDEVTLESIQLAQPAD